MKHQLSQQEIDSCFDAAGGTRVPVDPGTVPFDFRRLDRIPKSQVSSIHFLHEAFVRSLSSSLTIYLRTFTAGSLISVEQLPYVDFAETLSTPTCLVYLSMDPYQGQAIVEISPVLVAPILDIVLGGNGKIATALDREITEVEKTLLEGFFQILTRDLGVTWERVAPVSFAPSAIETSPQQSGRFVPNEAVVVIAMELRIGESVGMVNLAIPSITLKSMGQKFDQQWTSQGSGSPVTEIAIKRKLARDLQMTLEGQFSGAAVSLRQFLNLSVGDVIVLGSQYDGTVDILLNGTPKFRGALRVSDNNNQAILIV